MRFDDTDYSVVVKSRAPPPNSWRWEIYRAGKSSPIGRSRVFFYSKVPARLLAPERVRMNDRISLPRLSTVTPGLAC